VPQTPRREYTIIQGHVLDALSSLKQESIDCIIFSPPYWGLRDYGEETKTIWGGDHECEHSFTLKGQPPRKRKPSDVKNPSSLEATKKGVASAWDSDKIASAFCSKCGAWLGQLGMEPHPQQYIQHMTEICMALWRVLKKTGSMYINIGDTYYTHTSKRSGQFGKGIRNGFDDVFTRPRVILNDGGWLQPKQKLLIPHRLAISLQEKGWIIRNDMVWVKPNAMPSSVKDRRNTTFEYIFHCVKNKRYYYNLDAIRVPHANMQQDRKHVSAGITKHDLAVGRIGGFSYADPLHVKAYHPEGKNPGDVLEQSTLDQLRAWGADSKGEYHGKGRKNYEEAMAPNPSDVKRNIIEAHKKNPKGKNPGDVIIDHDRPKWSSVPGQLPQGSFGHGGTHGNLFNHPKGKNPGDVIGSRLGMDSKFIRDPVKTRSPYGRVVREVVDGKIKPDDADRLFSVGLYLKKKLKASRLSLANLSEQTGIAKTTLSHYFRSDLSGQCLPSKKTWAILKPILGLDEYETILPDDIKGMLPMPHPDGRNPGDVLRVTTKPFSGAHFAVFPPALVEPLIKSSCPPEGTVLDPFLGSGTTMLVARELGRQCIGIEINPEYIEIARKRVFGVQRLDAECIYTIKKGGG